MRKKNVAFDIDDTLWKVREEKRDQVPDYELISVLKWFYNNGDHVYVWSAGGVEYAQMIVTKLGLDDMVTVTPKGMYGEPRTMIKMDIVFDDEEVELGTINIQVER